MTVMERGLDMPRRTVWIVFVLSLCTLIFELTLSRMSVFYLNYANSFIAIPLTLFGLAIGSLSVHLNKAGAESVVVPADLFRLTIFSFISFAAGFLLFSEFFPITHRVGLASLLVILKTVAFVVVFLPPFYFVGRILTAIYAINRRAIGRLYGYDLFGASMACLVTPFLFHFIDLPYLISICLLLMTVITAVSLGRTKVKMVLLVLLLNLVILPFLIFFEGRYDLRLAVSGSRDTKVSEIAHRWNEYSRVSLLRVKKKGKEPYYTIIHDNAESNVHVLPYRPENPASVGKSREINIPFLIKRRVEEIMVMFAGCGSQMIEFQDLGGGARSLVGVEINPLVVEFAVNAPELKDYRIQEFYDLPNVEMDVVEGRRFLDNDERRFDVIYVGSDAATSQYKSGHSRKYLDTVEAMEAYVDHLRPDGLLMFHCQPHEHLVDSLKAVLDKKGDRDFDKKVILIRGRAKECDELLFSLTPFTSDDVAAVAGRFGREIMYAPNYSKNRRASTEKIQGPTPKGLQLVTDDRPFIFKLDFKGYSLFPRLSQIKSRTYYRSWIKITTLLVVAVILAAILIYLYLSKAKMPPLNMMAYLLITGFCYMLVEIAYIGKLELFLENPLYSMAFLLSIFLLTNAVGSWLYSRYGARLNMVAVLIAVAAIVLVSLPAIGLIMERRLGLPLYLKIPLATLVMAPVGVCLGLFYPFVVTWLTRRELAAAVPITYGISTLSSVAGATFAMTMIINFGYSNIIYMAAIGYAALAVFEFIYNRVAA